ncbi:MAG: methyltransferase domain-containing protein, partial [Candidatus Sungbacteria bacterium]|nr:methyltransferase domain-containing protein [Candidatus Sungbacteria bacterium]
MEQQIGKVTSGIFDPARIAANLGVRPGDHVADFGSGKGYFTIPFARLVGRDGKVYAIDIQDSALDEVRSRAAFEHLLNIEYIRADLDHDGGSRLQDKFIDLVLMANVLFQTENRDSLLREAWRVLRPGGRLAMIEWDTASDSPLGPLPAMRLKKEAVRGYAIQAGFEYDREFAAGPYHYGLLFIKK